MAMEECHKEQGGKKMYEKLDKLREELSKAKKKREDADRKVKQIENKLREAENTQICIQQFKVTKKLKTYS